MKFKSVFDVIENNCYTIKYTNCIYEPKKNQITGDALKYLQIFIDWCFRKEIRNKNESIANSKYNRNIQ